MIKKSGYVHLLAKAICFFVLCLVFICNPLHVRKAYASNDVLSAELRVSGGNFAAGDKVDVALVFNNYNENFYNDITTMIIDFGFDTSSLEADKSSFQMVASTNGGMGFSVLKVDGNVLDYQYLNLSDPLVRSTNVIYTASFTAKKPILDATKAFYLSDLELMDGRQADNIDIKGGANIVSDGTGNFDIGKILGGVFMYDKNGNVNPDLKWNGGSLEPSGIDNEAIQVDEKKEVEVLANNSANASTNQTSQTSSSNQRQTNSDGQAINRENAQSENQTSSDQPLTDKEGKVLNTLSNGKPANAVNKLKENISNHSTLVVLVLIAAFFVILLCAFANAKLKEEEKKLDNDEKKNSENNEKNPE